MLTPKRPLVEVAVDSVESAVAAAAAGADRLELCYQLEAGGLTPSIGLLEAVRERVSVPVFVMIRPRAGDFHYSGPELEVMGRDIERHRAAGAAGLVVGALTEAGAVAVAAVRRFVDRAGGLPVTFHRAIDIPVPAGAPVDALISAGVARVLSSGGAATAWQGRERLAAMVRAAGSRLVVMAGGGVRAAHVADLVRATGVSEIHLAGVRPDDRSVSEGFGRATVPARARVEEVMAALVRA